MASFHCFDQERQVEHRFRLSATKGFNKAGLGKLAAAVTYAVPYIDGEMTERVAARELDLQPAAGIAVLHALREVIQEMHTHDPYFDQIRNARTETVNRDS